MAEGLAAQRRTVGDDDAVQDGYLRVVQHGDLRGLANPMGYWYSAARNARRDRQRRESAEGRAIRAWLEIQPPGGHPERWSDDQLDDLLRAVDGLTGRRRRLIDLELEGRRDLRDLAATLGISEGAARVLRHRTYRQLRATLCTEAGRGEGADIA
jgi:RNA polymerase sigma factor (sigma-70 family)